VYDDLVFYWCDLVNDKAGFCWSFVLDSEENSALPICSDFTVLCNQYNGTETVQITLLKRTPASFNPNHTKCAACHQQGHAGSKILHQQNPPVLNWRCRLTQVVQWP